MTTPSPVDQFIELTQEGYDEIVVELSDLKIKQQAAIDRVAAARAHGDLSENSEYHAAREDLSLINSRIEELEDVINRAKVIQHAKGKNTIKVGSSVTLKHNSKSLVYRLVTAWEANPLENKISIESPIGKALMSKKQGDTIEVDAPAGKQKYDILKIE